MQNKNSPGLWIKALDLNVASFKPGVMIRCHHFEKGLKRVGTAEGPLLEAAQLLAREKVGEGASSALVRFKVT